MAHNIDLAGRLAVTRTPEEEEERTRRHEERRGRIGLSAERLRAIRATGQRAIHKTLEHVTEPVTESIPLRLPEYENPSVKDFERIAPTLIVILETEPLTKELLTTWGIRNIDERLKAYELPSFKLRREKVASGFSPLGISYFAIASNGRPYRYGVLRQDLDQQIPIDLVEAEIQTPPEMPLYEMDRETPKHAMACVIESLDPSDWIKATQRLQAKGVKKMKRFLDSLPPEDPVREMLKQKISAMLQTANEYFLQMEELRSFTSYVRLHVYARYFGFNPDEGKFMEVRQALIERSDTLKPAWRGRVLQSIRMMQWKIDSLAEVTEEEPEEEPEREKPHLSQDLSERTLAMWKKELCLLYHIKVLLSENPPREAIEKLYLENAPLLDRFVKVLEASNMLVRYLKLLQETGLLEASAVIRNYWLAWFQGKANDPSILNGSRIQTILYARRQSPHLMDSLYVASHALGMVDELIEKERSENPSREICVGRDQQSGLADRNFAQEVLRSAPGLTSKLMNLLNSYSRHVYRRTDGRARGR